MSEISEHPPSFRLDAHVAGDTDPRTMTHLASCEACAAYVTELTDQAGLSEGRSAEFVLALHDRPSGVPAPERRKRWSRAIWIGAPILAAAAALVLVRGEIGHGPDDFVVGSGRPSTRFKGGLQIAVVRDRNGEQSRSTSDVGVRPSDRLRVEIGLDDARPLEVGFLAKDGTWVELVAPALVEAGTHFSERAARFDDTPSEGWILAGEPDEVNRARTSHSFDRVHVITVVADR